MQTTQLATERGQFVVLGPCPGCESWQVEYDDDIPGQFVTYDVLELHELWSEEPVDTAFTPNLSAWYDAIEGVLEDHLAECRHLQLFLGAPA